MTKNELLDLIRLLAALGAWSFSTKSMLPDHLFEQLDTSMAILQREVLK